MRAKLSESMSATAALPQADLSIHTADSSCGDIAASKAQLTLLAVLATVGMLFAGFASAYLVRREAVDWAREQLPGILVLNTVVLLASSAALEVARAAHRRGRARPVRHWVAAGALLGLVFLGAQLVAWKQLAAQGVYLPSSAYSSFFFMLTAVHGVHLAGGILALGYLVWRVSRYQSLRRPDGLLDGCVAYWHFVDGVWVFVYFLLLSY
jgi:cytochrome c oxidase subunit 3